MSYVGRMFIYTGAESDFDILCTEFEPPEENERVEVVMELELNEFPFYRLEMIDRPGHQYFDLARPLLKYYITHGRLVDPPEEDHTGMIYNPISMKWKWF